MTVEDPAPAGGEGFDVGISGPPGSEATLNVSSPDRTAPEDVEIAGEKELTKPIPGNGAASFTVTLNAAGTYALTGSVDGEVVDRQTVTVREGAPVQVTVLGAQVSDPASPVGPLVLGGLALAALAAVLLLAKRRRRAEGGEI